MTNYKKVQQLYLRATKSGKKFHIPSEFLTGHLFAHEYPHSMAGKETKIVNK